MNTRSQTATIDLPLSVKSIFPMLLRPSAIRGWWQADRAVVVPEAGGIWVAAWGPEEDAPEYVTSARIIEYEPPYRMVLGEYAYFAKSGPLPFEADFTTAFELQTCSPGCRLTVTQDGFPTDPAADEFYRACEIGWHNTLQALKSFAAGEHRI